MKITKLHDGWKMRRVGDAEWLPAAVPGSVYNDLLANGKMEDPFFRDNELRSLALMDDDHEYTVLFDVEEAILSSEQVLLRFDGIDTVADIFLNGEWLAYVENMHRTWEFPVKEKLTAKDNELRVLFHSPVRYVRERYDAEPIPATDNAIRGFPYLRKAHCMFGWDWGPRLPDAGLWRDVSLVSFNDARLDSVYVTQKHHSSRVELTLDVDVERLGQERICRFGEDDHELDGLSLQVCLTDPEGKTVCRQQGAAEPLVVEDPKIWWPNGYGEQPLYTLRVELLNESGALLDTWEKRIGLRTVTMAIEKDEYGELFCHVVNGVRIFAMGADYIPEDNILARVTPERTRDLLTQAKLANHNCVRVWGGGYYPSDAFYDACDELGLIVWQDFMFACAAYRLTEEFEQNITAEFIDNIKRLRHHASLALWCGNNEMELWGSEGDWDAKPVLKSDYIKIFEYILPKVLKKYDPNTYYWPASPSSGGGFDDPNCESRGDTHYWDVWHFDKPITEFRKFNFRYVSEFGFQAFPSLKTCESFTLPEDRNIFSYVMEKHQRNASANGKIMNYMEQTFLYPTSFEKVLYASQLLQAEAIRYGVEHFRRIRGCCMGAVVWQLNDCWPVASWSSIDCFGRWKALHYYEKRFFAPILLSCAEEGILTQNTNPNAEPYEVKKSIRLNVSNETMDDATVTVQWALRDTKAEILRSGSETVTVPALSAVWLEKEDMRDASLYGNYVSFDCYGEDGTQISGSTVLFTAPKQFHFADPHLSVRVEGEELVVTADAYARSVEILNGADDMLLDDNYFDMNAGERRVRILRGKPEDLQIRSVYDIR